MSASPEAHHTRVFLDELPWDIRSKNTDWRYVRFDLPKMVRFEPTLELEMQTSRWITLRENIKILRAALGRRIGIPLSRYEDLTSHLSTRNLAHSKAQVVFAHRAFPLNAGAVPVIWQNAVLDPEMQLAYGATKSDINEEIAVKGSLYERAAAVQVSTEAEAKRLSSMFPRIAERFAAVPFFTPHVQACERNALQRHLNPGPVRILFTGNHVWRKSLDLLLEAFLGLPDSVRSAAEVTVISNFVGPQVALPQDSRMTVLRGADSKRVLQEMSRAHIFFNVARFESYGLVFHEAMSQGLACLAPDWEVQRELFDYGRAGRLLPGGVDAICAALEELICSPEKRYTLGLAAWERFQGHYAPAVVARRYADLFKRVAKEHATDI